ncbi:hypothetical protein, partial [Liquorilactobacillus sp.]|uniref:hypothetical protein n=1 Tax=Liquorilactobacillus sp. TaxID=2767923 RepID=UPI0039EB4C72
YGAYGTAPIKLKITISKDQKKYKMTGYSSDGNKELNMGSQSDKMTGDNLFFGKQEVKFKIDGNKLMLGKNFRSYSEHVPYILYRENSNQGKRNLKLWKKYLTEYKEYSAKVNNEAINDDENESDTNHDSESSSGTSSISDTQVKNIAKKVISDFKKQISGNWKYTDNSNSWGSSVTVNFENNGNIEMTEKDKSFENTNLTYKGTYSFDYNSVMSKIMDLSSNGQNVTQINNYRKFYNQSENYYLPINLNISVTGSISGQSQDTSKNTQISMAYNNNQLLFNDTTELFHSAAPTNLTRE